MGKKIEGSRMQMKNILKEYRKKTITLSELAKLLSINPNEVEAIFNRVKELEEEEIVSPVKTSGTNGNYRYPLYKKYHINNSEQTDEMIIREIRGLHPIVQGSGYLIKHPEVYEKHREALKKLSTYLLSGCDDTCISRKERSYEIFGREKAIEKDTSLWKTLVNLNITAETLNFYDTPEYCFHDYIPERKNSMVLLICENKDIWFNIRRCMFEYGEREIFDVHIDGVVYGEGKRVADKRGALTEYVRFMGNPTVAFLYWGDIDREGLEIFKSTQKSNAMLSISLFVPGYKEMVRRAIDSELEDSPSGKNEGKDYSDLLMDFTDTEKRFIEKALLEGKLIPQEIITYKDISRR